MDITDHYQKPPLREVLTHYGVKGMKWGVRRPKEELLYNKSSVIAAVNRQGVKAATVNGLLTTTLSDHAGGQAKDRQVTAAQIVDAVKKPLYISPVKTDSDGRDSQRFIGIDATVNVNPHTGVITTLWKTGKRLRNKYLKGES